MGRAASESEHHYTSKSFLYEKNGKTSILGFYLDNSIRVYQNSTTVNGPGYYFDSFALKDTLR
jgi:hypothetical protein